MILSIVVTVNFPGSTSFGGGALGNRSGQKKEGVENKILFKTTANGTEDCLKSGIGMVVCL